MHKNLSNYFVSPKSESCTQDLPLALTLSDRESLQIIPTDSQTKHIISYLSNGVLCTSIYCLFNDSVGGPNDIASNGRIIREQ
jgi:hypothetical protein